MLARLLQRRRRLAGEGGFTLIELLVVIVIIGILLAIAIPSYLGFKDRANKADAQANLRQAVPSAEAYYSDNNSYLNMNIAALKGYDSGLSTDVQVAGADGNPGTAPTATTYCLQATHGGFEYHLAGPGGTITAGACP
jgi:prepilin-type N-terminal cleavage/methylation domain-containing protein